MLCDLTQENIALLQQGVELVQGLDDTLYCAESRLLPSSAGKHLRHIHDFYQAFFRGLEQKGKQAVGQAHCIIDYDERSRDPRLEQERLYFCERMQLLQEKLAQLGGKQSQETETQVLEILSCEGLSGKVSRTESKLARELQFLLAHTVHHYALVALCLRAQGFEVAEGFGVACSTRLYLSGLDVSKPEAL